MTHGRGNPHTTSAWHWVGLVTSALAGGLALAIRDATALALVRNTALLALAAAAISIPAGCILACLLVRTDLPGRRVWLLLLLLQLFVPLYVHAAAWQAGFGVLGWFTQWAAEERVDFVWLEHWRAAVWVHALAALPWVVLIVGLGLRRVEAELEEAALLDGSPAQVFRYVTLRRTAPAVLIACGWVLIWTAGEMTVTDLFRVRTLAEELYTSFAATASPLDALRAALPAILISAALIVAPLPCVMRPGPRRQAMLGRPPLVFSLGPWRWPAAAGVAIVMLPLMAVPIGSLIYQAGLFAHQERGEYIRLWSGNKFVTMVATSPIEYRDEFGWSFLLAGVTATLAVMLGLWLAWLARSGTWRQLPAVVLSGLGLCTPGPLLALLVMLLLNHRQVPLLALLYDQTLLAPVLALGIKVLPLPTLVLWAALESVSDEVLDAARLEGAGPFTLLTRIALPQIRGASLGAFLTALALSLGDLATTILVLPPAVTTLPVRIFSLIHASVDDRVAGVCLTLLVLLITAALGASFSLKLLRALHSKID